MLNDSQQAGFFDKWITEMKYLGFIEHGAFFPKAVN